MPPYPQSVNVGGGTGTVLALAHDPCICIAVSEHDSEVTMSSPTFYRIHAGLTIMDGNLASESTRRQEPLGLSCGVRCGPRLELKGCGHLTT